MGSALSLSKLSLIGKRDASQEEQFCDTCTLVLKYFIMICEKRDIGCISLASPGVSQL